MTTSPAVSVVLPVYNGRDYLESSLESLLEQTLGDFELLIWDDASTDGSWDVARNYQDPRLRFHRNETNRGLFHNLNAAIDAARGPWIRLWSQDDRMKPHCLETERRFADAHPDVGFFYCQRDVVDARGDVVAAAEEDPTPEVMPGRLADEISFNWGSMPGNISTVTIRSAVLDEVGLFDPTKRFAADFDLWVRIQGRFDVGFCREALIELRAHDGQLSRRPGAELEFLRECRDIYRTLHERLPERTRARREKYSRAVHCAQYVQAAVRALARGEASYASRLLSEIHRWHHLGVVFPIWMMTANLHLYRPRPVYSAHEGTR